MPRARRWAAICALTTLFSCAQFENQRESMESFAPAHPLPRASLRSITEQTPGCLEMFHSFCKSLYAPGNEGAMSIPLPDGALEIRRGKTENDFSFAYFEYARTQIKNRNRLPADLRNVLLERQYFRKLRAYLSRKPRSVMRLEERSNIIELAHEIESLWNAAIDQTVLRRMEKRFPGSSQLKEDLIPQELRNESKRIRSILISEVSEAVWREHPNWKRVEANFFKVKEAFRKVISEHAEIPAEVKHDWLKRLSASPLVIPGSDPEVQMLSCSTTDENAYYDPYRDYVTVCAGDFNSEDIVHTIAHELAHSIDNYRSLVLFEQESELGRQMAWLRTTSCSRTSSPCANWNEFKINYPDFIKTLAPFKAEVPEFQACLQGKSTSPAPDSYVTRVAREEVQETFASLAEKNVFLRMITPTLPLPNGTTQKNPMYLNPCGYYIWDRPASMLDAELSVLLFFDAEYRCNSNLPSEERFQRALETSGEMQKQLVAARIRMEGELSSRPRLNTDGYAASPSERFADAIAGMVFAHILRQEPDLTKRRATFLANNAWLCQEPSLQQLFPTETGILKKYYVEPHSETSKRQMEVLQSGIRDALQCKLDFEINECTL